ncbi:helix-turn-helix domain-containing protein [Halobacillus sp. Nhm2S1]|uniref:helix-turn-helix domain-containing protein n=1 Tax=Halobacillus sp. Nhm2S1 TaxID=2866716 RepID=UPI001C72E42B|nr:helix-turn-helix transcriptional regulator [Halobacillus sp. Nhm2S1]MBX0358363.1 helix-turn-helix domain-containing protein [Halobacillus sp. Nhm2S1]
MGKDYDVKVRKAVGKQIKHLREGRGISQEEFAYLVGIDRTYISFIERGLRAPRLPMLYRIAYVLEVPASSLVVEVNDTPDNNR